MLTHLLVGAAIFFSTLTRDLGEANVVVESDIPCKPFREIYASGKELCEKMWDGSFVYETNRSQAYTMWYFDMENPNDKVTQNLGLSPPSECHLRYFHKDNPGPEPDTFTECHPWKEYACCTQDTVSSAQKIKESYGPEWHWDRCGPLTPACERFFVQEACFYECEPNAGLFRKFPPGEYNSSDPSHNEWQLSGMPIWADFCDAWYRACRNDMFCAHDDGNFFSCAAVYKVEESIGAGTVVGIVFACLIVVALAALVAFLVYRERTGKPVFKPLEQPPQVT